MSSISTETPGVERLPVRQSGGVRLVPRLVWPVAITSAILLIVGIGGAWYVLQLQTAASDILAWNVTSIRASEELEIGVRELRNRLIRFLLNEDVAQLEEIPRLQARCEYWLSESSRLARSPLEKVVMSKVEQAFARFQHESRALRTTTEAAARRELVRKLTDQVLWDKILKETNEYLDMNERELAVSSQQNQILAERLALSLLLIGVCGAAAGLLAGYGLARGIVRTIVQISLPIHDVAGKLDEIVGPISVSNVNRLEDLDQILRTLATQVTTVIERLRQREHEVLRAEQLAALGQLAAGLAHELRNPLMSMKILVQSAQSDEPGHLTGPDLDVLDDEIVRLEQLVSTFLDFARPTEPSKRPIELADVIEQTLELVSRQAKTRGVILHFERPRPSPRVEADIGQLRQVFLNLLLNSLDASNQGGEVWINIESADPGKPATPSMVVSVADNGQGMPEHLKATIFDPFVSSKPTGIGLGLTICKRIVLAHGGQISAADRPGGGAVFTLTIPLTQATAV